MISATRSDSRPRRLPTCVRSYFGLALSLVVLIGAVWIMEGGRISEPTAEASVITLAGRPGGVTPRIGEPAPGFALESLDGSALHLSQLRGRPVLVNFWASWCPPCRGEMPDLEKLANEYRGQGLVVVAVNLQEDRAAVQRYAEAVGLSFTIVLDSDGLVASAYNLNALPTTYFVDRDGNVRDLNIGALSEKGLRSKLAKVF